MSHSTLVTDLSPEVLALLAASYGRPADEVVSRIVHRNAPVAPKKASKLAAVKAAALDAEPTHPVTPSHQPPMTVIALPPKGTHDARGFLLAMRGAKTRDDQIKAIAGYCGFDRQGDYGTQDLSARMMAQRKLRGEPTALSAPVHSRALLAASGIPSLHGYVAGMPDDAAKRVADLLGRERLAADSLAEHSNIASDDSVDAKTRNYHAQLALVEAGRVPEIRADLLALGVNVTV